MITAIILEDEKNVSSVMQRMLGPYQQDITVAAVCYNVNEAEEMVNKHQPDLLFMDVELGKSQTCFDLLKRISPINFEIIFTTGYNRYAMQAIKLSDIDYLLKPIDKTELQIIIEKYRNRKSSIDSDKLESLMEAWVNPGDPNNKVFLPIVNGRGLVTIADIVFCESVDEQTMLVLKDKKELLVDMPIKEFESLLLPYKFYRIHKLYLINLMQVKKYIRGKEASAVMSNNANLAVSSSLRDKFTEKLKFY